MFRYVEFKEVNQEDNFNAQMDAQAHNISVLAEGVRGVGCLETRKPTRGEQLDYAQFIPFHAYLSSVEVYKNGAKNYYVRSLTNNKMLGALISRPVSP